MRIDIISAVPDLLESPLNHSIIKRAKEKGLVEIHIVNLHDYGRGNYKQIDDYLPNATTTMSSTPLPTARHLTRACATACPHAATSSSYAVTTKASTTVSGNISSQRKYP